MMRRKPWRWLILSTAIVTGGVLGATATAASAQPAAPATGGASALKSGACANGPLMCVELQDKYAVYGNKYVGHDEPSVLYYSGTPGAGNRNQWTVTLPTEPPASVVPGRSFDFQLTPAFWFGMAMCDSQSYPQVTSTCNPDTDANITPLAQHPGTAFMELQFYPPGWVSQFNSQSCDAHSWCAALTIDSLSEDPIHGTTLNPTCTSHILGGTEYVNFAFLTKSGTPVGSPNPLDFNPAVGGNPAEPGVFFMHQCDRITVTMHDTANGLQTVLSDHNTGQTGLMTASAANGFGQIKSAPTGTSCTVLPYNFHPMYSTSSPATRVPWAAHSYNIAFDEEIGHFDYCTKVNTTTGTCARGALEGAPGDQEPTDVDDNACFPASASLLVKVTGCNGTNDPGFDGSSYQKDWPDGNTFLHPTPELFTSPTTGPSFSTNYSRVAFESDIPANEGSCDRSTGAGCTIIPTTDDGHPATFYPFFSMTGNFGGIGCKWFIGNDVPGLTAFDFGKASQYGTLLGQEFLIFGGGGATHIRFDDFQQQLGNNPCPVSPQFHF
jgi:hypothetical protein